MRRRTLLLSAPALAVGLLALIACGKSANLKTLTVDDVAARIAANDGRTFVFDNNPHDRFVKSHVPSARWVQYDAVTAADLPADKGAMLVFYCASEL